jgi:hypothetical protein
MKFTNKNNYHALINIVVIDLYNHHYNNNSSDNYVLVVSFYDNGSILMKNHLSYLNDETFYILVFYKMFLKVFNYISF